MFFIALLIAYVIGEVNHYLFCTIIIHFTIYGIVGIINLRNHPVDVTVWTYFDYFLRFGFVLCTMLSWWVYCKLWSLYEQDNVRARFECDACSIQGVRITFLVLFSLLMLITVVVLFAKPKWSDYFWKALV